MGFGKKKKAQTEINKHVCGSHNDGVCKVNKRVPQKEKKNKLKAPKKCKSKENKNRGREKKREKNTGSATVLHRQRKS